MTALVAALAGQPDRPGPGSIGSDSDNLYYVNYYVIDYAEVRGFMSPKQTKQDAKQPSFSVSSEETV